MVYKHLFFDWDHTLWDFEANSIKVLEEIYYHYNLRQFNVLSPQHFIDTYMPINYYMWTKFREGKIDAETVKFQRFAMTFKEFGVIDDQLIADVKSFYLQELPKGGFLMPNVIDMLNELQNEFQLHIVTNGFLEVTNEKLKYSQIAHYFETVLSAEEVGVLKPNQAVFHEALRRANATVTDSLFIGDNLIADVQGARNVGMNQVFFNPDQRQHDEQPTFEISDMKELVGILSVTP